MELVIFLLALPFVLAVCIYGLAKAGYRVGFEVAVIPPLPMHDDDDGDEWKYTPSDPPLCERN